MALQYMYMEWSKAVDCVSIVIYEGEVGDDEVFTDHVNQGPRWQAGN